MTVRNEGRWLNKILSIVSLIYLNFNLKARKLDKSTRLLFSALSPTEWERDDRRYVNSVYGVHVRYE